jgi:hypothetical protein
MKFLTESLSTEALLIEVLLTELSSTEALSIEALLIEVLLTELSSTEALSIEALLTESLSTEAWLTERLESFDGREVKGQRGAGRPGTCSCRAKVGGEVNHQFALHNQIVVGPFRSNCTTSM